MQEKEFHAWIGNGDGKKLFRTTPEWCSQVEEFRDIYHLFTHPKLTIKIEAHGDGMLPHMWRLMRMKEEAGKLWNADGTPINAAHQVQEITATKEGAVKC